MKLRSIVGACAVAFWLGRAASAQELDATKLPAPVNVLSAARVGDWCVFRSSELGTSWHPVEWKVEALEEERATIAVLQSGSVEKVTRARATLTMAGLLDPDRKGQLHDLEVSDATIEVGGRSFACKKVTFVRASKDHSATTTAYLSSEVPASGIARLEVRVHSIVGELDMVGEVAGLGDANGVRWGKTYAQLEGEPQAAPPAPSRAGEPEREPQIREAFFGLAPRTVRGFKPTFFTNEPRTIRFENSDFARPVIVRLATVPLASWEDVVAASKDAIPELAPHMTMPRYSRTHTQHLVIFELAGGGGAVLVVRRVGTTILYGLGELAPAAGKAPLTMETVVGVTCGLDPR